MNAAFIIIGVVLLLAAVIDLLWTTLWVDGSAGPISAHLTTWIWRAMRRLGERHSRLLSLAGPLILSATLFVWVALLWAGWTLIFAGGEQALIDNIDGEPVTWAGRFYFVGYAMFTMGNGDFVPRNGTWQILAALTTASGMLLVTMAVSYVLSVLGAVASKRSFASSVTGLGGRSEDFVASGWNGQDFHAFDPLLSNYASQLGKLVEQHKSYPILHYYHSEESKSASALAVAILDDALTLLCFAVPDACRPNPALLESVRTSIANHLETLNTAFIEPADQPPPPPELERLRARGLPIDGEADFAQALERLAERRCKLLGMLRADAWPWPPRES